MNTLQPEKKKKESPSLGVSKVLFCLNLQAVFITKRLMNLIPPSSKALLIGEENPVLKEELQKRGIEILAEGSAPLIIALNVLADTEERYHRWAVSELAHRLPSDGKLLILTAIDLYSDEALPRLIQLLETEFKPISWDFIRLGWAIRLRKIFRWWPFSAIADWLGVYCLSPLATELCNDRAISHALFLLEKKPFREKELEPPLPERHPFQKVVKWE